jgi:hypothetical protein
MAPTVVKPKIAAAPTDTNGGVILLPTEISSPVKKSLLK